MCGASSTDPHGPRYPVPLQRAVSGEVVFGWQRDVDVCTQFLEQHLAGLLLVSTHHHGCSTRAANVVVCAMYMPSFLALSDALSVDVYCLHTHSVTLAGYTTRALLAHAQMSTTVQFPTDVYKYVCVEYREIQQNDRQTGAFHGNPKFRSFTSGQPTEDHRPGGYTVV